MTPLQASLRRLWRATRILFDLAFGPAHWHRVTSESVTDSGMPGYRLIFLACNQAPNASAYPRVAKQCVGTVNANRWFGARPRTLFLAEAHWHDDQWDIVVVSATRPYVDVDGVRKTLDVYPAVDWYPFGGPESR